MKIRFLMSQCHLFCSAMVTLAQILRLSGKVRFYQCFAANSEFDNRGAIWRFYDLGDFDQVAHCMKPDFSCAI